MYYSKKNSYRYVQVLTSSSLLLTDYVEEIFQTMVESIGTKKLEDAIVELNEKTPVPMNTMLNQQPREEAIAKKKKERCYATC
mgnify:CR=1 FL=1